MPEVDVPLEFPAFSGFPGGSDGQESFHSAGDLPILIRQRK